MNTTPGIVAGLVSITFRKLPPSEIVALATQAGLAGIEWGGDVHVPHGDLACAREVGQMTRDAGLAVPAYGSYYHAGESEDEGLEFEQVLATAVALDDCDLQYGDELERMVSWNGQSRMDGLRGRTVRMVIELKDADLFAMRFKQGDAE